MRIISKFKDFYDSALTYGIDTSIVYERLTDDNIGIGSRCYYLRRDLETRLRHWDYTTTLDTLIIADKFYHRVTLITRYHPYMVVSACTSTDLEKFTRDVGGGKFHESTLKMIEDYLKALKEVREAHRKIPILYIGAYPQANPSIIKLHWHKSFDANQVFQDVQMYLGNLSNPVVEIQDDKIKRDKHGFDTQSFKHR